MTTTSTKAVKQPTVVMVGTGLKTMGGISTVVKGYIAAGLFQLVPIVYVESHADGTVMYKLFVALRGYVTVAKVVAGKAVGLVHVHLSSDASFWRKLPIFLLCFLLRKPTVLHLHGSEFMDFYQQRCGPARRRIVRYVFDHASAVIALSPEWAENIRTFSDNPNMETIYNGVPVPDEPPERARHTAKSTILFLGRLGTRKGIYDLLEALARLKTAGHDFRLVAAGDGEVAEVRARAQELGLASAVDVPGWIDDHGKRALLQQADIFVLPSHAEGLPMSLLEALAAGLPVVCSSVGGMPTAISDGSEGFLVQPGDVVGLADALGLLLSSPELREKLGHNAFTRAKSEFDISISISRLLTLYGSLQRR